MKKTGSGKLQRSRSFGQISGDIYALQVQVYDIRDELERNKKNVAPVESQIRAKISDATSKAQVLVKFFQEEAPKTKDENFKKMTEDFYHVMEELQAVNKTFTALKEEKPVANLAAKAEKPKLKPHLKANEKQDGGENESVEIVIQDVTFGDASFRDANLIRQQEYAAESETIAQQMRDLQKVATDVHQAVYNDKTKVEDIRTEVGAAKNNMQKAAETIKAAEQQQRQARNKQLGLVIAAIVVAVAVIIILVKVLS